MPREDLDRKETSPIYKPVNDLAESDLDLDSDTDPEDSNVEVDIDDKL